MEKAAVFSGFFCLSCASETLLLNLCPMDDANGLRENDRSQISPELLETIRREVLEMVRNSKKYRNITEEQIEAIVYCRAEIRLKTLDTGG